MSITVNREASGSIFAVWQLPDLHRIGRDQLSTVVRATPAALISSLINATIVAAALWNTVSPLWLAAWLLFVVLVAAWLYRRRGQKAKSEAIYLSSRAIKRAVLTALVNAFPWAILPIAYLGALPHQGELVMITVLAGMSGGGSVLLAPVYPAALAYAGLILLVFALECLVLAGSGYALLGILTLSYAAFLLAVIATTARLSVERSEALQALTESANVIAKREAVISVQNARFETAMNNMTQGLCFFDGQERMIVCNRRFVEIYGLEPSRVKPGITLQEVVEMRYEVGSGPNIGKDDYLHWRSQVGRAAVPSKAVYELQNGRIVEIHYQPMADGGWVATHDDVTEKQRLQERLAENHKMLTYMATHDCLTGLANRALFRDKLEDAVRTAKAGEGRVALLMLDLNKFKAVNDTLGHPAGDALLKLVAKRLSGCVRTEDTVARLGGDEFAIVVRCDDAMIEAAVIAKRVRDALSAPFDVGGSVVSIGISIGIAGVVLQVTDVDDLIRRADLALYRAKADGGSRHEFDDCEPVAEHGLRSDHRAA